MAECVIVTCENLEEVAKARALWESPAFGMKLLSCNPASLFGKVRLYEFDAAAPVLSYRERDRYILVYTD